MISSLLEPLYGRSNGKESLEKKQTFGAGIQEGSADTEHKIPDGIFSIINMISLFVFTSACELTL